MAACGNPFAENFGGSWGIDSCVPERTIVNRLRGDRAMDGLWAEAQINQDPCLNCQAGWCNTSDDGSEFCQDSCETYKLYREKSVDDEPLFGTHLKEAKEILNPLFEHFLIRFKEVWKALAKE